MANPHSTDNYTIGKGVLTIAERTASVIGSYYDAGNAPGIEIEPTIERLPHYSARSGFRTKDKNPVIETSYNLIITLDEPTASNLKRFLMGTVTGGMVVHGLQNTSQEYAIHFVEDNAAGPNKVWDFWRGTLSPNGAMQLISDEWLTMALLFEGLADTVLHSASPYFQADYEATYTETSLSESSASDSSESSTSA